MKPKYSPMMMQYLQIKQQHPGEIIFFRLGDFYEMFFDDAIAASRELELALTGKNAGAEERIPMCGVPFHSASQYIQRLVEKNYRVAIVEQLGEAGGKGIVERGVVQIITPGTIFDDSMFGHSSNNYLACYMAFDFEYAVAYCDITTGEFLVECIQKDPKLLNNQLLTMSCKEVVCLSDEEMLFDSVITSCYNIVDMNDNYKKLFTNISDIKQRKVCSLLLNYMIETQKRELDQLQLIEEIDNLHYMTMDMYTKRSLELTMSNKKLDKFGTLYWLLDQTKCAMGTRILKRIIERPLVSKELIEERLDIIEVLNDHYIERESVRSVLKEIHDIERLSSRIAFGHINARDIKYISNSLKVLPELTYHLRSMNEPILNKLLERVIDVSHICDYIDEAIIDNPPLSIKEGNFIVDGYNSELDELRYIRDHGKDWLASFEQKERERTGIKMLKVGYNRVFGYYIEVTKGSLNLVLDEFEYTRKQSLTNAERFITPELKEMEATILSATDKMAKLEYALILELRDKIKAEVHILQDIARSVGMIDVYVALATVSSENNYTRPMFSDNYIDIRGGRHAVIEKVISGSRYVSNDVNVGQSDRTLLITGPNMGGKSTYMRQVALTAIMAQIGCFVPCDVATLPIFDQIFTRIGASDDLVAGQSTFMVEMLEANHALCFATDKSLILFDEIGRGTATFDGMAIAQSMLEYIASSIKCITLFSTHYHELTELENEGLGIRNIHASASVVGDKLELSYKVKPGRSNKSYGIHVATLAKLPAAVIQRASHVLQELEQGNKHIVSYQPTEVVETMSAVDIAVEKLDPNMLSPMDALAAVVELKKLSGR